MFDQVDRRPAGHLLGELGGRSSMCILAMSILLILNDEKENAEN